MKSRTQAPSKADAAALSIVAPSARDRFLLAARQLFYARGIHAVGVEAIAEAAQTNKMALYRKFKSKDDLIVAYIRQITEEGDASWAEIMSKHSGNPEKQIEAWVKYVDHALTVRYDRGCPLTNAAVELHPDHPARLIIEQYKQQKRFRLVELFRKAQYAHPQAVADEVFLLFEGARVSIQIGGRETAARLVKMLRDVLARAPRRAARSGA